MVADLSEQRLTEDVAQDLIGDIVTSMGELSTVRVHSFRFARPLRTRSLLAARGPLITPPPVSEDLPQRNPADDAVRAERLLRNLNTVSSSRPARTAVSVVRGNQDHVTRDTPPPAHVQQSQGEGRREDRRGRRSMTTNGGTEEAGGTAAEDGNAVASFPATPGASSLPSWYPDLLASVTREVSTGRSKAVVAANSQTARVSRVGARKSSFGCRRTFAPPFLARWASPLATSAI